MSFELTEDQKMMQKIARDFAEKEVAPGAEERDGAGRVDARSGGEA